LLSFGLPPIIKRLNTLLQKNVYLSLGGYSGEKANKYGSLVRSKQLPGDKHHA